MKQCAICNGKIKPVDIKDYVYDTTLGNITICGISKINQCSECKSLFIPGEQIERWNKEILCKLVEKHRVLKALSNFSVKLFLFLLQPIAFSIF